MASDAPTILVAVVWCLAVAGLVMLVRGWRGRRIDDHPLCRRCGYDLVANARATNCPECGRVLAARGAIRVGHRRRRPLLVTVGALMLVLGLGVGGVAVWSESRNFDWNTVKPLWLLRRETGDRDPWKAMYAEKEILRRLATGSLSQGQIDSVLAESLVMQADTTAPWQLWRGDFIEDAWRQGKVSTQMLQQYLETAIDPALDVRVRPRVRQGKTAYAGLTLGPMRLGANSHKFALDFSAPRLMADGQENIAAFTRDGAARTRTLRLGVHPDVIMGDRVPLDLAVGSHTLVMTIDVRVYDQPGDITAMTMP